MQDRLQEIKDKKQNAQAGGFSNPEGQDPKIEFVQEEIKKRPLNRKKMMRRMMMIAIMAAVFGAVACLFFLLLEPIFTRMLYPEEAVIGVTRSLMNTLRSEALGSRYFLVDVSEITSDTDWFNDPYETRGTVSGMIIAKTDSEVQVLVYSPEIESAQTIQITFFDGTSVEASIHGQDRVSGLAVLSADIEDMNSGSKDQIQVAELGSSAQSTLTGQIVIAVGRPTGTSGSIAYGAVTSASANLGILDSGLMQITTDIVGSKQGSGVLLNPEGLVVGILDTRHGRSDLPNLLCAIGITEAKQVIEKLSAGGKKAYLGVQCTDVPEDVRRRMDIPEGVYVSKVADGSPAMNAGLQKGDVIISMNGEEVRYSATLSRILLEEDAGTEIGITLMRPSGEEYTEMELTVMLE